MMRNFRVREDCPFEEVAFGAPSVGSKKRGEAFSTDDSAFILAFDCGQVEHVEEVAPVQETLASTSKKGKGGCCGQVECVEEVAPEQEAPASTSKKGKGG